MDTQTLQKIEIDVSKLSQARKEKGLSMAAVGRAVGLDRRSIWQYENGTLPQMENFTKLVLFYGKPLEYFIKGGAK